MLELLREFVAYARWAGTLPGAMLPTATLLLFLLGNSSANRALASGDDESSVPTIGANADLPNASAIGEAMPAPAEGEAIEIRPRVLAKLEAIGTEAEVGDAQGAGMGSPLLLLYSPPADQGVVEVERHRNAFIELVPPPLPKEWRAIEEAEQFIRKQARERDERELLRRLWLPDMDTDDEQLGFFHSAVAEDSGAVQNRNMIAIKNLIKKIGFRHLRSFFRSQLTDQFEDDPTFDYFAYLERREEINLLGRAGYDERELEIEQVVESTRNDLLSKDPDNVEKDITIITWGPLRLDDSGSLTFGFGSLRSDYSAVPTPELADGEPKRLKGASLFKGDSFRFDTDVKFHPDPYALFNGEGYREAFGKLAATAELDFLTPMQRRRFMSTEFEFSIQPDNHSAFFINFRFFGN